MTNDNLTKRLIICIDAIDRELEKYKDHGYGKGVLTEEFLDNEVQLLMDLTQEVAKWDFEDDRYCEILFNNKLNAAEKFNKMKEVF